MGWLDSVIFSCRAVGGAQRSGGLSSPVSRILARPGISPRPFQHSSKLIDFSPDLFPPPSRGPGFSRQRHRWRRSRFQCPAFTGTPDLTVFRGIGPTSRLLLGHPNSLHFPGLVLTCLQEGDLQWIIALVVGRPDTLERLAATYHLHSMFTSSPR